MKPGYRSLLIALALAAATAAPAADGPYKLLKEIPVGGATSWDYLTVDSDGQRLFIAHGTQITAIDLAKDQVITNIPGALGAHGFALAPELQRGFASAGRENKVLVVDLKTLAPILPKIDTAGNPDSIFYEPKHKEVYTFNGSGRSSTVIDATSLKVVATIPLGAKPEQAAYDPDAGRIYVNLEDKSEIAAIDINTHSVVANWPIGSGKSPTGLGFDVKNHRLFSACGDSTLVMVDSQTGKVLAEAKIGAGADGCAFDPVGSFVFTSNGDDGTISVVHVEGDKLSVVQTLTTVRGARTITIDRKTRRLYLAAVKQQGASRNFEVLVCAPAADKP